MRVKSARSIRKGASSGQTAASLVENHARKPPSSALIANHASKPALFEVPLSKKTEQLEARMDEIADRIAHERTGAARERTSTYEAQRPSH